MSHFLFSEEPIFANKTLARAVGINEAIILQKIANWVEYNRKTGKNFRDGMYWTYRSMRDWHEKEFDYMSFRSLSRCFQSLQDKGYLIGRIFDEKSMNRTKAYTINYELLEELYRTIEVETEVPEPTSEITEETDPYEDQELLPEEPVSATDSADNEGSGKCMMPNWHDARCQNGTLLYKKIKDKKNKDSSSSTPPLTSNGLDGRKDGGTEEMHTDSQKENSEVLTFYEDFIGEYPDLTEDAETVRTHFVNVLSLRKAKYTINGGEVSLYALQEKIRSLIPRDFHRIVHTFHANKDTIQHVPMYLLTLLYNAELYRNSPLSIQPRETSRGNRKTSFHNFAPNPTDYDEILRLKEEATV